MVTIARVMRLRHNVRSLIGDRQYQLLKKFVVGLIENTWIFRTPVRKRAVRYWAGSRNGRSLYRSIYGHNDGLENFLNSLSLNDLLDSEQVFLGLVKIQMDRIKESIDPGKKTVAICFPGLGYRAHVGNIPDKLRSKGYNVFTLLGEAGDDDYEPQKNLFYIPNNMLSNVDFADVFVSTQVGPFDHVTVKGKVVHLFHDIHDSALGDIENHYKIMLGIDYFFLASPFIADRLKHLISVGKQRRMAGKSKEKENCLILGGYPKLDGNIEYFNAYRGEPSALIYAPTMPPGKWMKEMGGVVATPQHSQDIIQAVLDNFPEYDLIFRPHPHSLHFSDIQDIAKRYISHPRFIFDDNVDFYMDGYARSALMITDISGTAYTYAFTTLRPVVFFSHNEAEVTKIFGTFQYFVDRSKIGCVAQNVNEMVDKIRILLSNYDEFPLKIKEYRDSSIYNIGLSEHYFVDNIGYILEDKKNPDWVYL